MKKLILASSSPRRKDYLESTGLSFRVVPSGIEETVRSGEEPSHFAVRLAEEKARDVGDVHPENLVLAADTIVVLPSFGDEGSFEILGKPSDRVDACRMLGQLQGRRHLVITGFCLYCRKNSYLVKKSVETSVWFRELDEDEIDYYVDSGESFDKAGAYGIQGLAGLFISRISGSYSNVVGLPIAEVLSELKCCGVWEASMLAKASLS